MSRSETEIQVQKLKESIQNGKMTTEEFKDRLRQIIDTELLKDDEEVDIDLIKACESFFTHLHGKEELLSEEERQQQWARIQDQIKTQGTKKRTFRKVPVYAAIAVAAIIILFFGISFRFQWFHHSSTPDGQQYVITGKQISIETISKAIAEHDSYGQIYTSQREEIERFLGFSLNDVLPMLHGWESYSYHAIVYPYGIYLKTDLRSKEKNEKQCQYMIRWYTDYDDIEFAIEQNEIGKTLYIGHQEVYRSENSSYVTFTWINNSTVYTLSGAEVDFVINEILGVSS